MNRRLFPSAVHLSSLACAMLLSACGGSIGKGIGPAYLTIVPYGGTLGTTSLKIYECFPGQAQALLYFTDGSVGDFSYRSQWSSSNTGVVAVSNGDIQIAGRTGFAYGPGVLVPAGPGTATVTANYQGLKATFRVDVGTASNIVIKRVDRVDGYFPVVPTNNATRIGVGSLSDFTVTAVEDGIEHNVENVNNLIWAFDQANNGIATVTDPGTSTTSGVVAGLTVGGPLTLRATFPACGQSVATAVSVANVQAVSITPEFTGNPPLIVGNTELFRAYADFGNGPEQDISQQVAFTSSVPATLVFGAVGGVTNLAGAAVAGTSQVSAAYTAGGGSVTSPQLTVTTVTDTLQSIAVTPKTASIVAGSDQAAQFNATGTYASGATQDVTRGVTWTVDNATLATILNTSVSAGVALSASTTTGTVAVTATSSLAAVGTTDTQTLNTTGP